MMTANLTGRELHRVCAAEPHCGGRDQVWRRRQSLEEARVERNRAVLRRWLRRVLTLGLWKK